MWNNDQIQNTNHNKRLKVFVAKTMRYLFWFTLQSNKEIIIHSFSDIQVETETKLWRTGREHKWCTYPRP